MTIIRFTLIAALALSAYSVTAARADDVSGAAKAFAQAQELTLAGDLVRAADLYELADELAPSAPALRNAARARLGANHRAMAATHAAELLRRYPGDKESRAVAESILSKLAPQLTELDVTCAEPCKLTIDGKAPTSGARLRHVFFAQPGALSLAAGFDGDRRATKQVTAVAGQQVPLRIDAPPRSVEPPPEKPAAAAPLAPATPLVRAEAKPARGLSRVWVIGAAVLTAGLGTAAALQGMATRDTRDEIRTALAANDAARAMELYDTGREQQLRTNILLGATAAAGASAVVLAVFTRWSSKPAGRDVVIAPVSGGMSVVYGARF